MIAAVPECILLLPASLPVLRGILLLQRMLHPSLSASTDDENYRYKSQVRLLWISTRRILSVGEGALRYYPRYLTNGMTHGWKTPR